ncbi:MAG: DUF4124 domain-containing protein [Gammaproteobacteria bacterium]
MKASLLNTILLAVLSLSASAVSAEIYKWTDEDGVTHYGQKPPAEQAAESFRLPSSVSSQSQPADESEAAEELKESEDTSGQTEAEKRVNKQKEIQAKKQNCENARKALENLKNRPRIQYINDEGERAFFTDEERQKRINEAQDIANRNCS